MLIIDKRLNDNLYADPYDWGNYGSGKNNESSGSLEEALRMLTEGKLLQSNPLSPGLKPHSFERAPRQESSPCQSGPQTFESFNLNSARVEQPIMSLSMGMEQEDLLGSIGYPSSDWENNQSSGSIVAELTEGEFFQSALFSSTFQPDLFEETGWLESSPCQSGSRPLESLEDFYLNGALDFQTPIMSLPMRMGHIPSTLSSFPVLPPIQPNKIGKRDRFRICNTCQRTSTSGWHKDPLDSTKDRCTSCYDQAKAEKELQRTDKICSSCEKTSSIRWYKDPADSTKNWCNTCHMRTYNQNKRKKKG